MLQLDRICAWLFIGTFACLIPGIEYIKFIDELCTLLLFGVGLADCIFNRQWKRYRLLLIIIAVLAVYVVYSMTFVRYNTFRYIILDALIQLKPFVPFIVFAAMPVNFTYVEKQVMKVVALINAAIGGAVILCGMKMMILVFTHPWYAGLIMFISAIVYLTADIGSDGSVSRSTKAIVTVILIIGLGCTRAKYYGEFIIAIFFLYVYHPDIMKKNPVPAPYMVVILVGLVALAGWNKFRFYFITGNAATFDPNVIESYARPVLYATAGMLLLDHFPLGTGLASFASFASAENYSTLYYDYGLDKVWGLSPGYRAFITDAFYPSLAQFGIAGVILFFAFWVYTCRLLARLIHTDVTRFRYCYGVGVTLISFLLIESIGSTAFCQSFGQIAMMIIGYFCGIASQYPPVKKVKSPSRKIIL